MSDLSTADSLFGLPVVQILGRADQIAATSLSLEAMLMRTLGLLVVESQAKTGAIYLLDPAGTFFVCRAARGQMPVRWLGKKISATAAPFNRLIEERQAILLNRSRGSLPGESSLDELSQTARETVFYQPLIVAEALIGVVHLLDCEDLNPDLMQIISNRMATEVDKLSQLESHRQERDRKDRLISILGQIGATLDPDEVLRLMIDYGRQVIHAEACSLFLVDEARGDIVLHLSTNLDENPSLSNVRVPKGKGIIGHVIETGETVLVGDVTKDPRHFRQTDKTTGFVTRAILTVPLESASFNQGERGIAKERIIGGIQALNKLEGTFDGDDAQILSTLAQHAATIFRMTSAVADNDRLFMDMIQWMIAAIDARDPYTEGHSKRVSEFSVEIARQLDLPTETVYEMRIGSLLHDIGKIGVPDAILRKPGRLTDGEYAKMKGHPVIGARMMSQVHSLHHVLPALSEHHERLNGSGYPQGLMENEISIFGRIVAVADVFDAMTSKRPYRDGAPAQEVLDYLLGRVDKEFDHACVDALTKAYKNGNIKTQKEREILESNRQFRSEIPDPILD